MKKYNSSYEKNIPNKIRFDLKIGDLVKINNPVFGDDGIYKVSAIYPYIFELEKPGKDNILKRYFPRTDYEVGIIKKVKKPLSVAEMAKMPGEFSMY